VQSCSSGTPERASSICCPQPVQVTFPQDEHEAGEHILISYISSSLPRDKCIPWGVSEARLALGGSCPFFSVSYFLDLDSR
jgi:hypothetical protein